MDTTDRDLELQVRRTLVPVVAGVIVARAARYGFDIPVDALVGVLEAVAIGIYYVVLSALERRFPKVGVLLGALAIPTYPPTTLDTIDDQEHDE